MTVQERRLIQRIGRNFAVVVILLPFMALGGRWQLVLVPMLVSAAIAFATALRLRRLQRAELATRREHGDAA
jgi:hypothetical protein